MNNNINQEITKVLATVKQHAVLTGHQTPREVEVYSVIKVIKNTIDELFDLRKDLIVPSSTHSIGYLAALNDLHLLLNEAMFNETQNST